MLTTAETKSTPVCMVRQPIFDRHKKVFAYQLLYRHGELGKASNEMELFKSANSLVQAVVEIGFDQLVGNLTAFVKLPREMVGDNSIRLLPKARTIIELRVDAPGDEEYLGQIRALKSDGYRLSLEDFSIGSVDEDIIRQFLVAKVDVVQNDIFEIRRKVQKLKELKVKVVAERVESPEVFSQCLALGFDYFEGSFVSKPTLVRGRRIPNNQLVLLRLLGRIQDPNVSVDEVEQLVASNVSLTFRLLQLVNSPCMAVNWRIDSIHTALMLLGLEKVSALVSLLAVASTPGKPSELMVLAMVRARMCELVATRQNRKNPQQFFIAGLFSVLEALFDAPFSELLQQIPLSTDLANALIDPACTNEIAVILRSALHFERGGFDHSELSGGALNTLRPEYVAAVAWTNALLEANAVAAD